MVLQVLPTQVCATSDVSLELSFSVLMNFQYEKCVSANFYSIDSIYIPRRRKGKLNPH